MKRSNEYKKGYQAGYQAGKRNSKTYIQDINRYGVSDVSAINPISSWYGEADGYADGVLVYDMWYCGACGHYFEEWEDEPTWNYCPICGARMRGENDDARY